MKQIFTVLAMVLATNVNADDWVYLIGNSAGSTEWHGLKSSYELRANKSGEEVVVWTEKENDKKSSRITVQKLYVKTAHCLQKQGKAVIVNMDGEFRYDFDFIFGVETVGTYRAEMLCKIYLGNVAQARGKSL